MNKHLLIACAMICSGALNAAADSLVPVSSVHQLQTGKKYVIATKATTISQLTGWTSERVLTAGESSITWEACDDPSALTITDNVVWTLASHDQACSRNHEGEVSFALISNTGRGYFNAVTGSNSTTWSYASDASTTGVGLDFAPAITDASPMSFTIHHREGTNVNRFFGINQNAQNGKFTCGTSNDSNLTLGYYVSGSNQWNLHFALYEVRPDAESYTISLDTGSYAGSGNWRNTWNKTAVDGEPDITVYDIGSTDGRDNNFQGTAAALDREDRSLVYYIGGNRPSTIYIEVPDGYYVTGYSFTAQHDVATNAAITITPNADADVVLPAASTDEFEVAVNTLTYAEVPAIKFAGNNQGVVLKNFTVQIATIDANKSAFARTLRNSGLYTSAQIIDATESQNSYENPEHAAIGYVVGNLAEGKVIITCKRGDHMNISGTAIHTQSTVNPLSVWQMVDRNDNSFKLFNPATGMYAKNAGAQSTTANADEASLYELLVSTADNKYFALKDLNTTNANPYLNKQGSYVGYWSVDDGSSWTFAKVTTTQETNWLNALTLRNVANRPGSFTITNEGITEEQVEAYAAAVTLQTQTPSQLNYSAWKVITDLNTPTALTFALFDLNTLENPALVTIDYNDAWAANKVVARNIEINNVKYLTTESSGDMFLLHDSGLYGYENGRAVILDGSAVFVHDEEADFTSNVASGLRFGTVQVGNNNRGLTWYSIKDAASGKNWGGTSSGGRHLPLDNNTNEVPAVGYGYAINYVDRLELAVSGDLFFRTPVAVELVGNDNVEAYLITVSGDNISTSKAAADATVYAPGTGFLFHGEGTMPLTVHNGEAGDARYARNIGGHHAMHSYSAPEGKLALVIATESTEAAPAEVRTRVEARTATVNMVAISANEAMSAHAATIEMPANERFTEGTMIAVPLGGSVSTGITEITADGTSARNAVYDLQGRRLSVPARGINIINGHKVLVR